MRGIRNKGENKWKKLGAFVFLLLVFFVLLNSVRNVYEKKLAAERALSRMKDEATELEDRNVFLKASLERVATEEGLEFEIRKKLNVAEVGESVAIIVDEGQSAAAPAPEISSWQKIKNFFVWLFE